MRSCEAFEKLVKKYDLMNEIVIGVDGEWTRKVEVVWICHVVSFIYCSIIFQKYKCYYTSRTNGYSASSFLEWNDEKPRVECAYIVLSHRILKTGVGIHEDAKRLLQYLVVDEVNGIVDLAYSWDSITNNRDVAQHMGHTDLKTSLQYLTEKYLNIFISKGFCWLLSLS